MCYYIRAESCRPEFGCVAAEGAGWFGCASLPAGAVGSAGTGSASPASRCAAGRSEPHWQRCAGKFVPRLPALAAALLIFLLYV